MARSHHRKKHKAHLQHFRHSFDVTKESAASTGKAAIIFAIGGTLFGFAISYFATSGSIPWIAGATIAGGIAGYFIGKKIDQG